MANVRQQETGGSPIVNRAAEIAREAAQRSARVNAENERKKQAQKDAEDRAAKSKADAEAARRKAEEQGKQKRVESDAAIDQKKGVPAKKTVAPAAKKVEPKKDKKVEPKKDKKVEPKKDKDPGKTEAEEVLGDITDQIQDMLTDTSDMYGYTPIEQIDAIMPTLRSAKELADLYGLDYNLDNIYNTLMKSVDAGYAVRYDQQDVAEGKYYDNAAVAQGTLLDTLDQQRSQAILAGTNRGMQAAQALSTMLGTSQQFAAGASQLAVDRGLLSKEYGAAKATTGVNALTQYNTMGQQLADISKNVYSSDMSGYAAQLGYNADVNTANSTMAASQMQAQSNLQSNLSNSMADIWNNYYSGKISLEQAQLQYKAAVESSQINANSNNYSAGLNAQSNANNLAASQLANQQNNANGLLSNVTSGIYNPDTGLSMLDGMLATGSISKDIYNATKAYLNGLKTPAPVAPTTPVTPTPTPTGSGLTLYNNDPLSANAGGGYKY